MKAIRKPNNQVNRLRKLAKLYTRDLAVTQLGSENCEIVHIPTLSIYRSATRKTATYFTDHPYKWTLLIAVFGRDKNGNNYMKPREIELPNARYQRDLTDTMRDLHSKLVEEFNRNHFLGMGWVAVNEPTVFDEETCFKLFENLGAFDCLAPWEVDV